MKRYINAIIVFSALSVSIHASIVPNIPAKTGVTVVSEDSDKIVLRCETGNFLVKDVDIAGDIWKLPLLLGEAVSLKKGAPSLPNMARSIAIPHGVVTSVRVLDSQFRDYPDFPVVPSKGSLSRSVSPASVPFSFGVEYDTTSWPEETVVLEEPYILRELRGQVVRFFPFKYHPQSKTLRVYHSIDVEIQMTQEDRKTQTNAQSRPDRIFRNLYGRHFLNYGGGVGALYTPIVEDGEMLVIAYGDFMDEMQPFVEWKRQSGIPTTLANMSTVGSTHAHIKSYVQSFYDSPTNNLTYLLLVGDAEQVPTYVKNYGDNGNGGTDPMYGLLAGSDQYPEVIVGRFSGSTDAHIETMVTRMINYEKTPPTNGTWYTRACGIASDEGDGSGLNGWRDRVYMEHIRTNLLAYSYTQVAQAYDYNESGGSAATTAQARDPINHGCSLVNYAGHGDVTEWATTDFYNSTVNALTNTHALPFIFNVSCLTGNFPGQTCFGEAWLRATHNGQPAGAIGIQASTINQPWVPPQSSQWEINQLLINETRHTFGGLCVGGGMKMMDDYGSDGTMTFETWHIFGDPSLMVRTSEPAALSVTHSNGVISDATNFNVEVIGVEGANVTLTHNGTLLGRASTAGDGTASIPVSELQEGQSLTLTATAFNRVPYTGTVTVEHAFEPLMTLNPSTIHHVQSENKTNELSLLVRNDGEAESVLLYSIKVERSPVPRGSRQSKRSTRQSTRNIVGSTISVAETSYMSGSNMVLNITATCQTPDDEWILSCNMDFPLGVSVVSASDLLNTAYPTDILVFQGETGNAANPSWQSNQGTTGAVGNGETATGSVSIAISNSFSGVLSIPWEIHGDEWGGAPHTVTGIITLAQYDTTPGITITSPNGGESLETGTTNTITWTSSNITQEIKLDLSTNGGMSWVSIDNQEPDNGSYSWAVPDESSTNCLVRISTLDDSTNDVSNAAFEIFSHPAWITVDPATGSLALAASNIIVLTIDSSETEIGTHTAYLNFYSSPDNKSVSVILDVVSSETGALGTPVSWLLAHGLTNAPDDAELADIDEDGIPAWREYIADTVPTNQESCFVLNEITRTNQNTRVCFPSSSGRRYTLKFVDILTGTGTWQTVVDEIGISGVNGNHTMNDGQSVSNRFYRVEVSLP